MSEPNRTPEQIARDRIDRMLAEAGWSVQDKNQIDFGSTKGIAVREYPMDSGPDFVQSKSKSIQSVQNNQKI
jgi:type I restriction enzyme R subunit